MDHVTSSWKKDILLHILLVEKEGRVWFTIICLKLIQFEVFTWWCLYALQYVMEFALQYVMTLIWIRWTSCINHVFHILEKCPPSRDK